MVLLVDQLALTADPARMTAPGHGFTRTRKLTPRRRAVTSFELSLEERAALGELAQTQGLALSEVLRRSLRLYAAHHGVMIDSEVDAAA